MDGVICVGKDRGVGICYAYERWGKREGVDTASTLATHGSRGSRTSIFCLFVFAKGAEKGRQTTMLKTGVVRVTFGLNTSHTRIMIRYSRLSPLAATRAQGI